MPRIRAMKPESFLSETLARVSVEAERTFRGMSTYADDRGRISDKPAQINAQLWGLRPLHTVAKLEGELLELIGEDALCRYAGCDGKRYIHFVKWDSHNIVDKPAKSRLPMCVKHSVGSEGFTEYCGRHPGPCPGVDELSRPLARSREDSRPLARSREDSRPLARSREDSGTEVEVEVEVELKPPTTTLASLASSLPPNSPDDHAHRQLATPTDPPNAAAQRRGTRLPTDFAATQAMVDWARTETPDVDGRRETAAFVDYWTALPGSKGVKLDWAATWRNWMRKAQTDAATRRRRPAADQVEHGGLLLKPETKADVDRAERMKALDAARAAADRPQLAIEGAA